MYAALPVFTGNERHTHCCALAFQFSDTSLFFCQCCLSATE